MADPHLHKELFDDAVDSFRSGEYTASTVLRKRRTAFSCAIAHDALFYMATALGHMKEHFSEWDLDAVDERDVARAKSYISMAETTLKSVGTRFHGRCIIVNRGRT